MKRSGVKQGQTRLNCAVGGLRRIDIDSPRKQGVDVFGWWAPQGVKSSHDFNEMMMEEPNDRPTD